MSDQAELVLRIFQLFVKRERKKKKHKNTPTHPHTNTCTKALQKVFGCPPPPALFFENWEKVFTVQKYTEPDFQNLKKKAFFFENLYP